MIDITDDFFNIEDFGQIATYTNTKGTSFSIVVIFDREFSLQNIGDVVIQNAKPQALCKSTDVPDADHETNATLTIGSTVYYVIEGHPDATGLTTLILSRSNVSP